ncbi:MAG: hypothetical protein LKE50_07510 [Atopobiaceae bacterium]|nr:hypothetical protein [Atopobiaceae bacterium]
MAEASPSRKVALSSLGHQRRRSAHVRDLLRTSPEMNALGPHNRALATRLVLGATCRLGRARP